MYSACSSFPRPRLPPPVPPSLRIPLNNALPRCTGRAPNPQELPDIDGCESSSIDLDLVLDLDLVYGFTTGEISRRSDASFLCLPLSQAASVRRS
jgi:hypothetical protein